jgi:hypothetical protein
MYINMSIYPRNLSHYLNRLSGYNKNNVKLNVLGSTTVSQSNIIQIDLPTNSIIDMSSLAWYFDVFYPATEGTVTKSGPMAEGFIDRLEVQINGQTAVNISNYNTLYHALLYASSTDDYQRQRRIGQSNNAFGGDNSGEPINITSSESGDALICSHVVDTWLGLLGSAKPHFIDTSLLGNVRIQITLATGNVISSGEPAGDPSSSANADRNYTMKNI